MAGSRCSEGAGSGFRRKAGLGKCLLKLVDGVTA